MLQEPTGLHLLTILVGAIPMLALVWWEERQMKRKRDDYLRRK